MLGESVSDFFTAISLTVIGWIEIVRLWRYYRYQDESIHYTHKLRIAILRSTKRQDEADKFAKDLRENWWGHHGLMSILMSLGFVFGIVLLSTLF